MGLFRRWAAALTIMAAGFSAASALAAAPAPAATAPVAMAATRAHALTAEDVDVWLDGFMPNAIKRGAIAGAVVVVVKDGQILAEKGFGYSDVAARTPVDPDRTLFRQASISKLFTWTAVMQLVEQGRLDLDADVNQYLDFKLPERPDGPVTLRRLMTHTAGFEESIKIYFADRKHWRGLGGELKRSPPRRVFRAGSTPAYSNYGAALAGYIVERVSGEPFNAYIERHILRPLGMEYATFDQTLPKRLEPYMSKGYVVNSAPPKPFEFISTPPSGGLTASGADMARFMIAHLQNGRFGESQILKPETAVRMHTTLTQLVPPLNGIDLGFYEQNLNGQRIIGHGGDLELFHSYLMLFIDRGVGVYFAVNSAGKNAGGLRNDLMEAFADRYFPAVQSDGVVDKATALAHARQAAGSYVNSRSAFGSFAAILTLLGQPTVTANPDGTISLSMLKDASGAPRRYREIAPYVWRDVLGRDRLAAVVTKGEVTRIASDQFAPALVLDRAPWFRTAAWIAPAATAGLAVLALAFVGWPVLAIARTRYGARFALAGHRARAYRWTRVFAGLSLLVGLALFILFSGVTAGAGGWVAESGGFVILALEALVLVALGGGFLASLLNLSAVFAEKCGWWTRLWGLLMTASFVALLWASWAGGLLTFTTHY